MSQPLPTSIFDLPPLETGGVESREGLAFQDHVAAGFCLEMLLDPTLEEVWCETQDDITLIRKPNGKIQVEFVQVKRNEKDQLWSIAMLCDREGKGVGRSILERSLANDRCSEPSAFRLVTVRPVRDELKILIYELASGYRTGSEGQKKLGELKESVKAKVIGFKSKNGNDGAFWIENSVWDERHSEEFVKNQNLIALSRLLEDQDVFLAEDQRRELYDRLVSKVWAAGRADYKTDPSAKRITQSALAEWMDKLISRQLHPAAIGTGEEAERKMREAGISEETIRTAQELRRSYRREVLRPEYLAIKDRRLMEGEVLATLQQLKSRLDVDTFRESGVEFHHRCLVQMKELQQTLNLHPRAPLMFLEGYMYNVVDRCLHRFLRARP